MKLTAAQRKRLEEIREAGTKVYDGRARRFVQALEAAGLVTVNWGMETRAKGNGIELVERIKVRIKKEEQ